VQTQPDIVTAPEPTGISRSFVVVGAGLALIGIGSLGLLAIASRALDDDPFAKFGVWFGLVNVISFGLFVPLETAIARLLLSGAGFAGRLRHETIRYACVVLLGVVVLVITFQSIVMPRLMNDSWLLVVTTVAYLSTLAMQAVQRGVAVGHNQFWPLFWQFGVDGVLRLALPAVVLAAGLASPGAFAVSVVLASSAGLVSGQIALAMMPASRDSRSSSGMNGKALSALVVAALGAQLLANGAPPILSLINRDTATVLAGVVGALALTRLPLLFASAIQAPLLPPMVRFVLSGDTSGLWTLLKRLLAGFGALGLAAFAAGWYLGAPVLRTYLGDDYGARPVSMALLTSAGIALLAVVAVQAALVAIEANGILAASWGLGTAVFLLVIAVPADGLTIAPISIALATTVTLGAMLTGLRWTTASRSSPSG
jgi:O-antigen/teichoic acid export membrane protein